MSSVGFEADPVSKDDETAAFCLSLPGKTLYLTPLLALKKFRKRGNKDGAVRAFYRLHEEGLGKVLEVTGSKGTSSVSRCCISKHFHVDQVTIYKDDYELVLAGWSGTATDCPLPDSTCWDIPGHPRMSQLCRQCKVPGTRYPGIPQDIPGCPRPGGSVRSQSPRSKMSWDIWGHPRMSQTWRQC